MKEDLILGGSQTLVILLANFDYQAKTGYANLSHAKPSHQRLRTLLGNSGITGIALYHVIDIVDKPMDEAWKILRDALEKQAKKNYNKLLFYYIGHGSVRGRGELYLPSIDTLQHDLEREAIRYTHIADRLYELKHIKNKIVVLDCCRSGHGGTVKGGEENYQHYFEHHELKLTGSYFIGASSSSKPAGSGIDKGIQATEFTDAFINVLSEGTENDPLKIVYSDTFQKTITEKLPAFPPVFKNNISDSFQKGVNFPFYYNQKFKISFVRACIEDKRYHKAEDFLVPILAEEKYSITTDAKEAFLLLMKVLLDEKSWTEAADLLIRVIGAVGKNNSLVALTNHDYHHIIQQQANVYMVAEDYIQARELYNKLIVIDDFNDSYAYALLSIEESIEARDQGIDKPKIIKFQSTPKGVVSGAELVIEWKVENMRYLEIFQEPGGEALRFTKTAGKQKYVILESTKFKLVATNFHDKTSESNIYVRAFQPPLFKNRPVPIPVYRQKSQIDLPNLKQFQIDLRIKLPFKNPAVGYPATEISPLNNRTLYHLYERIKNKFRRY